MSFVSAHKTNRNARELIQIGNRSLVSQKQENFISASMTLTTHCTRSSPKQVQKKKAVSFTKCSSSATFNGGAETFLQATDARRNYLRRGSKTPAMLLISNLARERYFREPFASCSCNGNDRSHVGEQERFECNRLALELAA